jgi:hypothetical protein
VAGARHILMLICEVPPGLAHVETGRCAGSPERQNQSQRTRRALAPRQHPQATAERRETGACHSREQRRGAQERGTGEGHRRVAQEGGTGGGHRRGAQEGGTPAVHVRSARYSAHCHPHTEGGRTMIGSPAGRAEWVLSCSHLAPLSRFGPDSAMKKLRIVILRFGTW